MKYIKVYEGFWGDRYFWKVDLDYLEMSLTKIKTPPLRMKNGRRVKAPKTLYKKMIDSLSWGDDDNEIFVIYNNGDWDWSATWNEDRLKDDNYEYEGEIELEPHEKDAKKFNL